MASKQPLTWKNHLISHQSRKDHVLPFPRPVVHPQKNWATPVLTFTQTSPGCYVFAVQVFRKHHGKKRKLLIMSNFSFSHSVFCPSGELSAIFIKSETCVQTLSVWKSLKFIIWERVKGEKNLSLSVKTVRKWEKDFDIELIFETNDSGHIYQNSGFHTFHFASSNLHLASWISWHSQFFASG